MSLLRPLLRAACAAFSLAAAAAEPKVLNLYNWADYFAPQTLARFTRETGIAVRYDKFDSNEVLQAKLLAGKSGYDLVFPAVDFVAKQIAAGVFQPVDRARLPGWRNLDPLLLGKAALADPGNRYAVPYLWGTSGVAIRREAVRKALGGEALPADPLALLFEPRYAARLARCGIGWFDAASNVAELALAYGGADLNRFALPDLEAGFARLKPVRPTVRQFLSVPTDALAAGELCAAMAYSGDAYRAMDRLKESGGRDAIDYLLPAGAVPMWMDTMAIPKDAPHPDNAHRFIDFMLRPEVVAEITNALSFANPNQAATPLVDAAIRQDARRYPDEATKRRLVLAGPTPKQYQLRRTALFGRFKESR